VALPGRERRRAADPAGRRARHADGERADQLQRAKAQLGHHRSGLTAAHRALHHRHAAQVRRRGEKAAEGALGGLRDALPERVRVRRGRQRCDLPRSAGRAEAR